MFYELRVIKRAVNKMKEKREGWEATSVRGLPTKVLFKWVSKRSEAGLYRPPADIKTKKI